MLTDGGAALRSLYQLQALSRHNSVIYWAARITPAGTPLGSSNKPEGNRVM
jgi:hypothetical protein